MNTLRASRTRVRPEHVVLAIAAVPVVIMAVEVLAAPRLHFLDYWSVFARVTHDDGSLYPRGIFTLQNEHPMFLPGLLFWLEAKVFGGYNQLLGLFGVAVGPAQLRVRIQRGGLAVGQPRRGGCRGAGRAGQPARRRGPGRGRVPVVRHGLRGVARAGAVRLAPRSRPRLDRRAAADRGRGGRHVGGLATIMSTLGQSWSTDVQVASLAGAVTAVGLVTFGARVVRRRIDGEVGTPEAAWLAVATYAVAAIVMIAVARTGSAASAGDTGRYASVPALATCALVALAVMRWQRVATTRLVVVSAYPFTEGFNLPCGAAEHALGEKIDVDDLPALTVALDSDGNAAHADTPVVGDAVLEGWALIGQRHAECVLITDRAGTVVGGGVVGLGREDLPTVLDTGELLGGWKAVASPGLAGGTVLVGAGDRLYRIG